MDNSCPAQSVRQIGSSCSSAGNESACNVGDLGSIPGLGRSPGEGKGYPLRYSGLENSMDCIEWDPKSGTQLTDSRFTSNRSSFIPPSMHI